MGILKNIKCKDCDGNIAITDSDSCGDVITCSSCGLEYELKNIKGKLELTELSIEGEDWGE